MYVLLQPYRCNKCGYDELYTPSLPIATPVLLNRQPVCPVCWDKFLKENLGIMECQVSFDTVYSSLKLD